MTQRLILVFLLFSMVDSIQAQNVKEGNALIANETLEQMLRGNYAADIARVRTKNFQGINKRKQYSRAGNNTKILKGRQKSFIAQYNPLTAVLKGSMYVYQELLSPQLSRSCPYEITCSNFSKQSIQYFGVVKGVFLSADRILRCNRIGLLDVPPLSFSGEAGSISDSPDQYKIK